MKKRMRVLMAGICLLAGLGIRRTIEEQGGCFL